jgi:predicted dehydrogenase
MKNAPVSTPKPAVNVAVVGLGFMGVTHLRAYQQIAHARILAVCDSVRLPSNGILPGVSGNIKQAEDINLGPDVRVCRHIEEVLALKEVDLVDLCTPTSLHPEQAIAALNAGKNVLCEKPLARTSSSAREILRVLESAPGFLMPAMCMRFWPGWSWLKQVVEEGTYGRVLIARFRRMSAMPAWSRQGTYDAASGVGGALYDLHIHDTDFVQFLFGRPRSVFSTGVAQLGGEVNHVVTQYLYPRGPAVFAEGSWLLPQGFQMAYTLHCERAMLDFDLGRGREAMQVSEVGKTPRFIPIDSPDGYNEEIRYVVDCVRNGRHPQIVTGRDGLTALEICEAEEQSVKTGLRVSC